MPLYDKAFWFISFFLVGVLFASSTSFSDTVFIAGLVAIAIGAAFFVFGKKWLALLSIGIFLGSGYYVFYDVRTRDIAIPFDEKTTVTGLITKVSTGLEKQSLVIKLNDPLRGRIRVTAPRYPEWNYGDVVTVEGTIRRPDESFAERLAKDGIFGTTIFADIKLVRSGEGSLLKSKLLSIKHFTESAFRRALPPEKAAFLSGLTLGETAEFTKEFRDKLSVTGTSHLVALSGYNVNVIAESIMAALGLWFSRRKAFWFGTTAVALFVVMTGAEASVVRAAIMAFLVLLAEETARAYSFRNAIVVAAVAMVLVNPRILRWDIGFQLSFAAVLGLIYLRPAIITWFNVSKKPGFFHLRENLITTTSAQLAVLPILLANFGSFSPISIVPNVLILAFVPITMFLGFSIAALAVISSYLALAVGLVANLFLSYELGVINFFSMLNLKWEIGSFGIALSILYYAILISGILYINRRTAKTNVISG